jgi:hypothetical protein
MQGIDIVYVQAFFLKRFLLSLPLLSISQGFAPRMLVFPTVKTRADKKTVRI